MRRPSGLVQICDRCGTPWSEDTSECGHCHGKVIRSTTAALAEATRQRRSEPLLQLILGALNVGRGTVCQDGEYNEDCGICETKDDYLKQMLEVIDPTGELRRQYDTMS